MFKVNKFQHQLVDSLGGPKQYTPAQRYHFRYIYIYVIIVITTIISDYYLSLMWYPD